MNKLRIWLVVYTLILISPAYAQNGIKRLKTKVPFPVCYASGKVEKSFVPPPSYLNLKSAAEKKCEIIVSYSLFPQEAKDAFEYAVNIWEHILESDVPIYVQANWRSLSKNTLGSAGPSNYYTDFENIPHSGRYYPVAVVEKITKTEITGPTSPDITASFNKDIDWYFGTDGKTPFALYDFVSIVLHEITHGLGFTGFFYMNGNQGVYGYNSNGDAAAFDLLVVKDKIQLVDTAFYRTPSTELGDALVHRYLYAASPVAMAANRGLKPRLYSPSEFDEGSSIYHLNDLTYPSGSENSLMTHAVGSGEANHNPGPLTSGIMFDIGWRHPYINLDKPKDIESIQPISFTASVESEYELDSSSLFIYYSYDNFATQKDSLPLANTTGSFFSAELTPTTETGTIHYYLSVEDSVKRTFRLPTEAPRELYSVTIGKDTFPPEIDHSPIPYFLLANDNLTLTTNVDDNLGVDTVFVEYEINGVAQPAFGLTLDTLTSYSGSFNFNLPQLADGDEVTYSITAKDLATVANSTTIPEDSKFAFKVEKIFDPVGGYINNFNGPTSDFILSDFDIYTDTLFEDAALHGPHPYPSPNDNNLTYNFSVVLKRPIILYEGGKMTFDEIVLVEPGEYQSVFGDDDFWDYVIVEGSKDYGKSWQQLADGYDSGDNLTWKVNYNRKVVDNVSQAVGVPEWYINREIDMLASEEFSVNDTILIRFRLFSDPFAHGWGWAIDNLRIQFPVSSPVTTISPGNVMVYPNPFNNLITVSVQAGKNIDELELNVFNLFGKKIHSVQVRNVIGEFSQQINLGNYADGMYLVSVNENGKQVFSKKIIKNSY